MLQAETKSVSIATFGRTVSMTTSRKSVRISNILDLKTCISLSQQNLFLNNMHNHSFLFVMCVGIFAFTLVMLLSGWRYNNLRQQGSVVKLHVYDVAVSPPLSFTTGWIICTGQSLNNSLWKSNQSQDGCLPYNLHSPRHFDMESFKGGF